jgi:hypothetical protein
MKAESVYDVTNVLNRTNLIKALIVVGIGGVNILGYELCRSGLISSIISNDTFKLLGIVNAIEVGIDGIGQGLIETLLVGSTLGAFATGVALNGLAAAAITACIRYIDTPYSDSVKDIISSAGTFVSRTCSDMMASAAVSR